MELYVGLDVSLKQTSICVVDGSGEIVSEGTVISEPAAIAEFIKAKAGNAKRIGPPCDHHFRHRTYRLTGPRRRSQWTPRARSAIIALRRSTDRMSRR